MNDCYLRLNLIAYNVFWKQIYVCVRERESLYYVHMYPKGSKII